MKKQRNKHIGSSFEDFLEEEGIAESVNEAAIKRLLALQIAQAMEEKKMTKVAMAQAMGTSRSSLDRFLDPDDESVTLRTMQRAARAVGKLLTVTLEDRVSSGGNGGMRSKQSMRK